MAEPRYVRSYERKMAVKTPTKSDQLVKILRECLQSGEFPAGAQFLTEREIASTYGVSRAIAAKAVYRLASENLLEPQRGRRGPYVLSTAPKEQYPTIFGMLYLSSYGMHPMTRLLMENLTESVNTLFPGAVMHPFKYLGTRDSLATRAPNFILSEMMDINVVPGIFLTSPISSEDIEYFYSRNMALRIHYQIASKS